MEDLHAVLDAAGSSNPVIFGAHEGSTMAALFAASYPERTRALVLFHARADGSTYRTDPQSAQEFLARLRDGWGVQEWCDVLFREVWPSLAANEEDRRWFANSVRLGATPAVAYALNRAFVETDLRDVLPAVHVPTLLFYRSLPEEEEATMDVASRIPARRRCAYPAPTRQRSSSRPRSQTRSSGSFAGEEALGVPESVLEDCRFHRHRRLNGSRRQDRRPRLARAAVPPSAVGPPAARPLPRPRARHGRRRVLRDLRRPGTRDPGSASDRRRGPRRSASKRESGSTSESARSTRARSSGLAVNIGARVASNAGAGEVLALADRPGLVAGSGMSLEDRRHPRAQGEYPGAGSSSRSQPQTPDVPPLAPRSATDVPAADRE